MALFGNKKTQMYGFSNEARHYFDGTDFVIFVVDSSDRERMQEAKEELAIIMGDDLLQNCGVLVYANKQDLPNACNASEMADKLGLVRLRKTQPWYIQTCCAVNGQGLYEGLDFI